MRRLAFVAAFVALLSCNTNPPPPGDETLGSFALHADPSARACDFVDVPDSGFDFTVTYSHWADGGAAYITLAGIPHPSAYDGVTVTGTYTAPRSFASCGACPTTVTETMTVFLLSKSQNDALGSTCPASPAGIPLNPDAGISGPAKTAIGYDAARACGTLHDAVTADSGVDLDGGFDLDGGCSPSCFTCTLDYTLSGESK